MENMWTLHYEGKVKQLIERDSAELKAMVRQDLKRLENLMITSFEKIPSDGQYGGEGRRSLSEIPSLRQSIDSQQEENAFVNTSSVLIPNQTQKEDPNMSLVSAQN
jgi:hypothetical protein